MADIQYILSTFLLLISGALVFWMAAGFSMLECGLVRAHKGVEILKKNVGLYSLSCLAFLVFGYSLMFCDRILIHLLHSKFVACAHLQTGNCALGRFV